MLRIPFKKLEGRNKIEIDVEFSEEIYNLLCEFCEWTGNDVDTYIEYCVLDSIKSELNSGFTTQLEEINDLKKRIRDLSRYF